jgi:hypothetical protein
MQIEEDIEVDELLDIEDDETEVLQEDGYSGFNVSAGLGGMIKNTNTE